VGGWGGRNETHDCLESADLLFLGYHASPSTTFPTDGLIGVFAVDDTFHDFAEKSNALSIGNDGAIWVVISRVELDSLASEFESLCEGTPRGWARALGSCLRTARGMRRRI
jgi:hypothetical protein